MAGANRTWGAERIRGERLKLHIRVAKWTIQKYMRGARPPRRTGQTWAAFLRNHGQHIWVSDFLPVTDLLFRQLYAFFVIEIASRRVVHVGVTRHPSDAWVTQQLREATPFGRHPKHLIRQRPGPGCGGLSGVLLVGGMLIDHLEPQRADAHRENPQAYPQRWPLIASDRS
jgi:putative transposase